MGTLKEQANSVTHLQDNTSSALSNGSSVACATHDFDNTSPLGFTASARLTTAGWGSTSGIDGTQISLYLVPYLDATNIGTNPITGTAAGSFPPGTFAGSFQVEGTGTVQYLDIQGIPIGPYKYRAYVLNSTGQQMSANWTVDIWPETEQY